MEASYRTYTLRKSARVFSSFSQSDEKGIRKRRKRRGCKSCSPPAVERRKSLENPKVRPPPLSHTLDFSLQSVSLQSVCSQFSVRFDPVNILPHPLLSSHPNRRGRDSFCLQSCVCFLSLPSRSQLFTPASSIITVNS